MPPAFPHRKGAGQQERVEPVQVAARGQDLRRAHQVAPGRRADIVAVQGADDGLDLVILHQQGVGAGQVLDPGDIGGGGLQAADLQHPGRGLPLGHRRHRGRGQGRPIPLAGHGGQKVDPLLQGDRLAHRVQACGDQLLLDLGDLVAQVRDPGGVVGALGREVETGGLLQDEVRQAGHLLHRARRHGAPALDRALQLHQVLVEAGLGHRRGQVADQGRRRAALGQGPFGGIVGGVEIEVGQVADQPLGPAAGGQAHLLAGHEFQRPVGAEVQHGVGVEILAEVAIEGREGVSRRKAPLEQQAHGIALIAEARLQADEHIAEPRAQHEQGAAVGQLAPRRRAPLGLDGLQERLAADVILHRNTHRHIGVRAVAGGVAAQQLLAQGVHRLRDLHRIAGGGEPLQGVVQGGEDRQERRRARGPGLGREVEQDHGQAPLGPLGPAERDHAADPRGDGLGPFRADLHPRGPGRGVEHAVARTAFAGLTIAVGAAAEHAGRHRAVELGDRDHDGGFHRVQPRRIAPPGLESLELQRLGRDIGHTEARQDLLRRAGVVVGGTAHQGEAGEGQDHIHHRLAVLHEELLDRRTAVQAAGEGWNDPQALGLQRLDDAVIMTRVVRQDVGAQDQHAHHAPGRHAGRRQRLHGLDDPVRALGMIQGDFRVLPGGLGLDPAAQGLALPVGVAAHEEADHGRAVVLRPRQPVLHGQEIGPQVLGGARDEAEDLGQPPQHGHLACAGAGPAAGLGAVAPQALQQRDRPLVGAVHLQAAKAGELDDLAGGDQADHGVAVVAARLQGRQDGADLLVDEQHRQDDDVACGDVVEAPLQGARIVRPVRRRMQPQLQTGNVLADLLLDPGEQSGQVAVQGDEHDPHRGRAFTCRPSGRSGYVRHKSSRSLCVIRRSGGRRPRCCDGPCRERRTES